VAFVCVVASPDDGGLYFVIGGNNDDGQLFGGAGFSYGGEIGCRLEETWD
jgi:hypothetical protein